MAAATGEQAVGLTVQEMARRSGFSEPTLRYYEKIGLLGVVARDEPSGHRRYAPDTVARVEALSCLRSSGMTVSGMRRYLELLAQGHSAAADQRDLFASQARKLAADIEQLQLRLSYLRRKADLWDARVHGDAEAENDAVEEITRIVEEFTH